MSRMDRYYKSSYNTNKRTTRNVDLYKTIYKDSEYTNIEGIADIDKSNEVDISKIKDMLKSREDYQSGRELKSFIPKEEPVKYETFERDTDRVYDIRDILNEARTKKTEDKYHNLSEANIELLKELKNKSKEVVKPEKLETMIDTITNTSKLNKLSDSELGLELLDLQSDNTLTSSNTSIKSILEEAKKQEEQSKTQTDTKLDNSFFTSSMSFSDADFEGINELKKNVNKNSNAIKIIMFIVLLSITLSIALLLFNILK